MSSLGMENHHCTRLLDEDYCPIANDCETGSWESWSLCSEGEHPTKKRTRKIERDARNGGKTCCPYGMYSVFQFFDPRRSKNFTKFKLEMNFHSRLTNMV